MRSFCFQSLRIQVARLGLTAKQIIFSSGPMITVIGGLMMLCCDVVLRCCVDKKMGSDFCS